MTALEAVAPVIPKANIQPVARPAFKADGKTVRARRKQIVKSKKTAKKIGVEHTARHHLRAHHG